MRKLILALAGLPAFGADAQSKLTRAEEGRVAIANRYAKCMARCLAIVAVACCGAACTVDLAGNPPVLRAPSGAGNPDDEWYWWCFVQAGLGTTDFSGRHIRLVTPGGEEDDVPGTQFLNTLDNRFVYFSSGVKNVGQSAEAAEIVFNGRNDIGTYVEAHHDAPARRVYCAAHYSEQAALDGRNRAMADARNLGFTPVSTNWTWPVGDDGG